MARQRGDSWQGDLRSGSKRFRKSFATQNEAEAWELSAKARLLRGDSIEAIMSEAAAPGGDGWTMRKLLDAVVDAVWKGTPNEEASVRNSEEVIEILGAGRHPSTVRATDIDLVKSALRARGIANSTVNRKLAALSKLLSYAHERGIVQSRAPITRMKESEGRLRWYTTEEEARLLQHCSAELRPLLIFLLDTGARLGEALKLRVRDVGSVFVELHGTKNGRNRGIPLTERCRSALAPLLGPDGDALVFGAWSKTSVHREFTPLKLAAGITDPEAVVHSLRHTCASRMVQRGVAIQVVQQWLGHRTLTQTLRYAHLAPTNLLSAMSALEGPPTLGRVPTERDIVPGPKAHPVSVPA